MQTQTSDQGVGYTVARILAISPEQVETRRRNYSRIFVVPTGEGIIDSILFQGQRPMKDYMPSVARAIAEGKFIIPDRDIQLRTVHDPKVVSGVFFQSHITTNGWLQDENEELYDLVVELNVVGETIGDPEGLTSYDGATIEGAEFESPLCFKIGVENLSPDGWNLEQGETINLQPMHEPEVNNRQQGNGQGRVVDPTKDGRLKQNRERPQQMVTARAAQDRDDTGTDASGRMPGRPGRIKNPYLDGRLSAAKRAELIAAQAGGR